MCGDYCSRSILDLVAMAYTGSISIQGKLLFRLHSRLTEAAAIFLIGNETPREIVGCVRCCERVRSLLVWSDRVHFHFLCGVCCRKGAGSLELAWRRLSFTAGYTFLVWSRSAPYIAAEAARRC